MLQIERRTLTLPEAVCSILNGQVVPELYEIDADLAGPETEWKPGKRTMSYRARHKQRVRPSPLAPSKVASIDCKPGARSSSLTASQWILQSLDLNGGVMASVPVGNTTVTLSRACACGHAEYWIQNLMDNSSIFNEDKTHRAHSTNRIFFEANLLTDGVPAFLPEGDVYGLRASDMDSYLDAGLRVEIRKKPYATPDEPVHFTKADKAMSLCTKELTFLFEQAARGVAPCVVAAFFTRGDFQQQFSSDWGSSPLHKIPAALQEGKAKSEVSSMITISQISTFSLASLMDAIKHAPVESKRTHLKGVLAQACKPIFSVIGDLIASSGGNSMVKVNMTPESIVFCPNLVEYGNSWTLEGIGFMPVSKDYLDGVPKITDFNAMFTTRVRDSSFSYETSFVMHSMLLIAFSRAKHGAAVADVLWDHLLAESDPSGFVKAARDMQSKPTNASAFLAYLAADSDMRESADVSKAMAELVSDMDTVVRDGVIGSDGSLSVPADKSVFSKLVSVVTGSSSPDTAVFSRECADECDLEATHVRALEAVKQARQRRLDGLK